jgi:hypothetical protein
MSVASRSLFSVRRLRLDFPSSYYLLFYGEGEISFEPVTIGINAYNKGHEYNSVIILCALALDQ